MAWKKKVRNSWEDDDNKKFLEMIGHFDANLLVDTATLNQYPPGTICSPPVLDFIKGRNPESACGVDGISYRILINLHLNELRNIFNWISEIWINLNILDSWRNIKICPILKRGKDLSAIENYRPICLLSVLLKSLEHLIKGFIDDFIRENHVLPARSYDFRKKHSTSQCINDVINSV